MNAIKEMRLRSLSIPLTAGVFIALVSAISAAPGPALFSDFDSNGDGFLSKEEHYAGRAQRMAKMAELGGQMRGIANAPKFEQLDTDKDQQISAEEFNVHQQMMKPGARRSGMGYGKAAPPRRMAPQFDDLDANANGLVDSEEFDRFHQQRKGNFPQGMMAGRSFNFADLDLNRDGVIDAEEFNKHQQKYSPRR